jgi:glucose-6-phosphate-specific signal transduction histidine kinase
MAREVPNVRIDVVAVGTPLSLNTMVRDDGYGIEERVLQVAGQEGQWGIAGMQERAHGIGADLSLRRRGRGRLGAGLTQRLRTLSAFVLLQPRMAVSTLTDIATAHA